MAASPKSVFRTPTSKAWLDTTVIRTVWVSSPLIVLLCLSAAVVDSLLQEPTWRAWWLAGALTAVAGVASALISARHRADEGSSFRTTVLERLVQMVPDGVIALDDRGIAIFANDAAERVLGTAPGALIGSTLDVPRSDGRHLVVDLEGVDGAEGRVVEFTATDMPVDGTVLTTTLVRDVTSLADVSQRVRRVEQAHERFLHGVSRDIRDPLTVILGFASILKRDAGQYTETEISTMCTDIAEQADSISALVDDLLIAGLADPTALAIDREPIDLEGLLGEDFDDVPIRRHTTEPTTAWGDTRRTRQIVRNLVDNARRHGGGSVWIELAQTPQRIRLSVCDDGPGIEEHGHGRLFQAYGGDPYAGGRQSGGIGLHVARLLARRMGGDLRYRREGPATRFEISLDRCEPASLEPRSGEH